MKLHRFLGKRGRITIPYEDFLDSLSEEEQRDALVHLSLLWAEKQKH